MLKETNNGKPYCELTAALMDNGDISVTLVPVQSAYTDNCLQASEEIAKLVNNPPKELINSILRPVAASASPVKPTAIAIADSGDGKASQQTGAQGEEQVEEGSGGFDQDSGAVRVSGVGAAIVAAVAASLLLLV